MRTSDNPDALLEQGNAILFRGAFHEALQAFAGVDERSRQTILRSHFARAIEDPAELTFRRKLDAALEALSLLELAIHVGEALPSQQLYEQLRFALSSKAFYSYAFEYYPMPLVARVCARAIDVNVREPSRCVPGISAGLFFDHVMLLDLSRKQEPLQGFLSMIDGYWGSTYPTLASALHAISSYDNLTRILQSRTEGDNHLAAGQALLSFLMWSGQLDELLRQVPGEFNKSMIWHHFGYWFRTLGLSLSGLMAVSVRNTLESAASGVISPNAHRNINRSVQSLLRLSGTRYAASLDRQLESDGTLIHLAAWSSRQERDRPPRPRWGRSRQTPDIA